MPGVSRVAREERERLNADGQKRCVACVQIKPHAQFNRSNGRWDGLYPNCRACRSAERQNPEAAQARAERQRLHSDGLKYCSRCQETKPHAEFSRSTGRWDGLYSWCNTCNRERVSDFNSRNRETWGSGADPYADPAPKRCPDCTLIRPRTDFTTNPSFADGLCPYCRGCWNARVDTRKALQRQQFVEHVDRAKAWRMAGGICYLCGHAMDPNRWDLDHVYPIVHGGEHSYFNTAPTHPECNRSKGAKTWPKLHVWDHTTSDWALSA